jgi:hypothetical protein
MEIRRIEDELHGCIKAVHENYDDYCQRAVEQDAVTAIPLSMLQSNCRPRIEAVLVASRRKYLTREQLDCLVHDNASLPVKVVTYDALLGAL